MKYEEEVIQVQIEFTDPYELSRSFLEPDFLSLKFKEEVLSFQYIPLNTSEAVDLTQIPE